MATLRYIANDILTTLKLKNDDAQIKLNHVVYWVQIYADRLKVQHFNKIDSGAFLHTFINVPVLINSITHQKYVELPSAIYDLDKDKAIDYVSYAPDVDSCSPAFTSITFGRTTPKDAKQLYWRKETTPSPSNPYFYREAMKYIYFLGFECIDLQFVNLGLLSSFNPASPCPLDDEFDFPPELLPVLQRQILDLGRLALMIPDERLNQGNDDPDEAMPKSKLMQMQNENDQAYQQQTQQ